MDEIAESFTPGSHGSTFGGNPLACSVASVVVDEVKKILPHVEEVGRYFKEKLISLNKGKVKGRGLMLGLETGMECKEIVLKALENGLVINCTADKVLRFLPPLIVEKDHVDIAIDILRKIL